MVVGKSEASSQTQLNSPVPAAHDNYQNSNDEHANPNPNPNLELNNINTANTTPGDAHPLLGRQSSIYSWTLDEFQHALCENGKDFGSMNMDEFLNSIWTAEESQNLSRNQNQQTTNNTSMMNGQTGMGRGGGGGPTVLVTTAPPGPAIDNGIAKQPSLARQASLTLPAPLCRKTVDEVWLEIQQSQQQKRQPSADQVNNDGGGGGQGDGTDSERQPTFGEMTLEDFLVKAGVVREQCLNNTSIVPQPQAQAQQPQQQQQPPPAQAQHHQHQQPQQQQQPPPAQAQHQQPQQQQQPPPSAQYGLYENGNNPQIGHPFGPTRPRTGGVPGPGGYPNMAQNGVSAGDPPSVYGGGGSNKTDNSYVPIGPPPPAPMCYGAVAGGGGYGAPLGVASPVSPLGQDVLCGPGRGDGQSGVDVGALRGRKRTHDGPVERPVDRRQRRMIKNRESAARSRARKQAYTVELEAELNQLREENAELKQEVAELKRQRNEQAELQRQQNEQYAEQHRMMSRSQTIVEKDIDKPSVTRRVMSCPL